VTLNRANIMLRDRYACQYCGSNRELTIDHVVAQSKGGGNTWTNLVACCAACNSKKGDKSLEQLRWKLRQQPKVSGQARRSQCGGTTGWMFAHSGCQAGLRRLRFMLTMPAQC
jgi:5-methylcytosine-specific restriction endonuclease McrA